jgi:sulfoacetaldehyde dehydrogenase
LIKEGGYLVSPEEKQKLLVVLWDAEGHRTPDTVAISAQRIAARAGFEIPADRTFITVEENQIGKEHFFSSEKLCVVLSIFKYSGFENALQMVEQIFEVGGKGHSCGIYSFDEDHIHRLALMAPVSRIMVRQPQSKANAGAFNNGMPMTSSLGCGTWGGNITSENIHLKHYMNTTWVSRPIPEDRPSEQELFGEFYDTETF